MAYFQDNLLFLLAETGIRQSFLAERVGVSSATVTKWLKGGTPKNKGTLRNLAQQFAAQLNIDIGLLNNGHALIERDIKLLKKPEIKETSAGDLQYITKEEHEFIVRFREIYTQNRAVPLDPELLNKTLRCLAILDRGMMDSFLDMMDGLRQK